MNGMTDKMRKYFLDMEIVAHVLAELKGKSFLENRNKAVTESPTADAINAHFSILYNISNGELFVSKLGEQLREQNFFQILKPYVQSEYVVSICKFRITIHG